MTKTAIVKITGQQDFSLLDDASDCIRSGGLVAFATETVYGVGCRCNDPEAYAKLVALKGRPQDKPFTVHLSETAAMDAFGPELSCGTKRIIATFMPGPLTVVVYCRRENRKIGFRVPEHAVACELIKRSGGAVYATSANMSGAASPKCTKDVIDAFPDGAIDIIVDSGPSRTGRDSTVVDVAPDGFKILRQGAITEDELRACWNGE